MPRRAFAALAEQLDGFEWDVVGSGMVWSYEDVVDDPRLSQTWLRDPDSDEYRLDVFREPSDRDLWVCRFEPSITLPYSDLIRYTADGIPYATPEVVLLFKSRSPRDKDDADFHEVLPEMAARQTQRLASWLRRTAPRHPWLPELASAEE